MVKLYQIICIYERYLNKLFGLLCSFGIIVLGVDNMSKTLVAYFSCSGVTRKLAEDLCGVVNGDLYEIKPVNPYTDEDLDWTNNESRSSVEMNDKSYRPEIINDLENIDEYDVVYLGFPIWWYQAPTIINTFLEKYDFTGKKIIPFATSGSSGRMILRLSPSLVTFSGSLMNTLMYMSPFLPPLIPHSP